MNEFITTEEMAKTLKISTRALRYAVNSGRIPVSRINRRLWRFHLPTVTAALAKPNGPVNRRQLCGQS